MLMDSAPMINNVGGTGLHLNEVENMLLFVKQQNLIEILFKVFCNSLQQCTFLTSFIASTILCPLAMHDLLFTQDQSIAQFMEDTETYHLIMIKDKT